MAVMCALRFCFATSMPNRPWPAARSSTEIVPRLPARTIGASCIAAGAIIGAMLWAKSTLAGKNRPPAANDLRQPQERLAQHRVAQEPGGRGHRGRGTRVEELGADLAVRVPTVRLDQEAADGEVVAENPDAALGGPAALRDRRDVARPFADGAEEIELDAGPQRLGALVRPERLENQLRRGAGGRFHVR